MAQARQEQQRQEPTPPEDPEGLTAEEAAAAIAALLLLGGAGATVGAIAAVLMQLPGVVPNLAERAARLTLMDLPTRPQAPDQIIAATWWANLMRRGLYAANAATRLSGAYSEAERVGDEGPIEAAVEAERRYFGQHVDQSETAIQGAVINAAAVDRYGRILGWIHPGRTKTHRREHERAHRQNYDPLNPPAATSRFLPAQALFCECVPGPPWPGAPTMS